MFEIIIFIFIGIVIYKRVQRVKQDGGIKGNNSLPNTTVTTKNPREALGIPENADLREVVNSLNKPTKSGQTLFGQINPNYVEQNNNSPMSNSNQNRPAQPMAQPHPTKTAPTRSPAQHTAAQAAIREAKEDGNSTTAYLMEKAEADAREHAKEKFEEQKRLRETRGGLDVAERLLEGDPIPQGKKLVNCGYCGAENLVPMMPRTRYSCYFCREAL